MSGRFEQEQKTYDKIERRLASYPPIATNYYHVLKAQGKTYATVKDYMGAFFIFMDWHQYEFGPLKDDFYKDVTSSLIMEFLETRKKRKVNGTWKKMSSSPAHVAYSALKIFYDWLLEEEMIDRSPVRESFRPKQNDEVRTTYLTEAEVAAIMQNIKKKRNLSSRDLLFFAIGVTTGLRCSAILNIDVSDIDFEKHTVKVIEKGDKVRTVIFSDELMRLVNHWLPFRSFLLSRNKATTDALFISWYGKRLGEWDARDMLKEVSKGVTEKEVTPHVLRHTCATILYDKTRDIYLVSSQLGHSQISTTQRYAAIFDESKQQAADIMGGIISSK